ncbi:hypothetical protein B566_EDAN015086, partial [Ephemera danica]
SFEVQSVINDDGTVKSTEAAAIFNENVITTVTNAEQLDKWRNLVNTATLECDGVNKKTTQNQVKLNNGRVCSMRPIEMLTCIRRHLLLIKNAVYKSKVFATTIHLDLDESSVLISIAPWW